jgi:hypothetical protein
MGKTRAHLLMVLVEVHMQLCTEAEGFLTASTQSLPIKAWISMSLKAEEVQDGRILMPRGFINRRIADSKRVPLSSFPPSATNTPLLLLQPR